MILTENYFPDRDLEYAYTSWMNRERNVFHALDNPGNSLQRSRASAAVGRLHEALAPLSRYRELMDAVTSGPSAGLPWGWKPLLDDECTQAGLLYLEAGKTVPLHDHPEGAAALRVISGRIDIIQGDPVPETSGGDAVSPCKFPIRWSGALSRGTGTFFTASKGNIHTFMARTDTLLLDVFFTPYEYARRSWFVAEKPSPAERPVEPRR